LAAVDDSVSLALLAAGGGTGEAVAELTLSI
jgi:hypothetical protein